MKSIIVYRSKYGTARKCAEIIADRLRNAPDKIETSILDLKQNKNPDIRDFDIVIIGGSIYGGMVQQEVRRFCEKNNNVLLEKTVGLYICCFLEGRQAEEQLAASYPPQLINHARVKDSFGGQINYDGLSFIDRFLVRRIADVTSDLSNFKENRVVEFSKIIMV